MRETGAADQELKVEVCRPTSPHLRAAAFFAFLTFLFFSPVWLTGREYAASDFLYRTPLWYDSDVELQNFDLFDAIIFFYPDYDYLNKSLKGGEFPFWNPYNLGGRPVAFNGSSGYFYPPRVFLHSLLSTTQACTAILVIHIFAAGFFMYLLGSRLALSFPAALFVGTAWMFNGWNATWFLMEHAPVFSALLPIGLLALRHSRTSWRGTVSLAVVIGLTVVAGSLQLTYYCWAIMVLLGAYFVFSQAKTTWLGSTVRVGAGFVLGVLLSAPMLVPTVTNMLSSQRPTLSLSFLQTIYRESLFTGLATFIFPDLFGNPADDFGLQRISSGGYFIYSELCAYVGVASLFLFGLCFWMRGLPRYVSWLALTVLVVPATPLYQLVYWLPGLNRINSTRLVFFWLFFVALGSGFGFDALTQRSRRWLSVAAGTAMALWITLIFYLNSGDPRPRLLEWLENGKIRLPDAQLYLTKQEHFAAALEGFQATYGWGSWAVLAPLIWLGLFIVALRFQARRPWILVTLLALDLLTFGIRFNPKVQSTSIYEMTPTLRFLQERAGLDRVMGVGTIKPNTLMPFQLYDAGGYDAFYPQNSGRYFTFLMHGEKGLQLASLAQAFPITDYRSPLVNLLGVRYFVAYPGQELQGCTKVLDWPLPIFENPRRIPRAFIASSYRVVPEPADTLRLLASGELDPGRTVLLAQEPVFEASPKLEVSPTSSSVEIVSYRPHEVRLQVRQAPGGGCLVLTDAFADGWTAEVNGKATPVLQAHLMFRAVALPSDAADFEVVFRYAPPGFSTALALFYFGLTMLFLLFFFGSRGAPQTQES